MLGEDDPEKLTEEGRECVQKTALSLVHCLQCTVCG